MTPPPKLEVGRDDDDYPLNEMGSPDFHVGGVRRLLPARQQLEQLLSYLEATYDFPELPGQPGGDVTRDHVDRFLGRLPDRITHASMLMLGTAVDHAMPGVATEGASEVGITEVDILDGLKAAVFVAQKPTGRWVLSLHPGGLWAGVGQALDIAWRSEVAAACALSGASFVDLDYPLLPEASKKDINEAVTATFSWIRQQHPQAEIGLWGQEAGADLALAHAGEADFVVATFPSTTDGISDVETPILIQQAVRDSSVPELGGLPAQATAVQYVATPYVSTPETARQRIADLAQFLRLA